MSRHSIICGDVFAALAKFPTGYFDACLGDPPYHIEFMGRAFDRSHKLKPGANDGQRSQAWHRDWLDLVLPLLKPGGRLVAASGSRVYHRLASAAEDSGFSIDPLFAWINGQAMAQGGDISKLIDRQRNDEIGHVTDITAPSTPLARLFHGYGTRLKDSVCPWLMAYKPVEGSFARNAELHGVAGLNVEAGRVPTDGRQALGPRITTGKTGSTGFDQRSRFKTGETTQGRYPSNLALDPEAAEELGRQSGALVSGSMKPGGPRTRSNTYNDPSCDRGSSVHPNGDEGTAARFFHTFQYHAKAGPGERMLGCERFFWRVDRDQPLGFVRISQAEYLAMGHLQGCRKSRNPVPGSIGKPSALTMNPERWETSERGCEPGCHERQRYQGNIHPTLKPIELCRYLARLILPPPRSDGEPRRLLVPFSGTGSEMIGALLAGWDEVIGIEAEAVYCDLKAPRIAAWGPYTSSRANAIEAAGGIGKGVEVDQMTLYDLL